MSDEDGTRIPPLLLQRLLQEFTEDDKTRISQPAVNALTEYFRTFVREAIWRAAQVRKGDDRDPNEPGNEIGGRVLGGGTVFLEVEDLEKVAPQLLLDF